MTDPAQAAAKAPGIIIQPDAARYFEAAASGVLMIKQCHACGQAHFYPRQACPFCSSQDTAWIESSGSGTVYTYTVLRKGHPGPSIPVFIALDEGPTLLARMVGAEPEDVRIGMRVKACFPPLGPNGAPLLAFAPDPNPDQTARQDAMRS
ncbi:putative OB-fold protein [Novosphingobium sp. 1529]|uniref:Zn-ribbon domain-containing OB-fold protein n=1 Tax=Novosphingobium sp. 1529 TaxID=3156424 RepID=UPI003396B5F6